MTHVTCRLTAKDRDRLRNPTLGNRVWATVTVMHCVLAMRPNKQRRELALGVAFYDRATA